MTSTYVCMLLVICLSLATNHYNCNIPFLLRDFWSNAWIRQFVRQKGPFACIETCCLFALSILLTRQPPLPPTPHIQRKQRRGTVGSRPVLVSSAKIAPKCNVCVAFKSAHEGSQKLNYLQCASCFLSCHCKLWMISSFVTMQWGDVHFGLTS